MNENTNITAHEVVEMVDSKEIRQKYIDRVEVLDKVKRIVLIPQLEMVTTAQVADFYSVSVKTIQRCYQRNCDEINSDGVVIKKPQYFKEIFKVTNCFLKDCRQEHGKMIVAIDDNTTLIIPNVGIRCFSKRAVLRFGMLLRDSKVAQEVRTQLLNITEHAEETVPEILTAEIDKEQQLLIDIAKAYGSGDLNALIQATQAHTQYLQRHINSLKESNDILAGNTLKWNCRQSANAVVRIMAQRLHRTYSDTWNLIYHELLYKHGVNLKARSHGEKPHIATIKAEEWKLFYESASAIMQANGITPSDVFRLVNRSTRVIA